MSGIRESSARHEPVAPRRDGLFGAFGWMLAAQSTGAVLGLLFWIITARWVPAAELGTAAAAISVQTLLGGVATLGLQTLLVAELPHHSGARRRQLLVRAVLGAVLAGGVVGLVVVAARGLLGTTLHAGLSTTEGCVAFVVGVLAAAAALVVDGAALGQGRSSVQVWRNLLASGLRFPLAAVLIAVGHRQAADLQVVWVAPLLVSVVVALVRLHDGAPFADADSGRSWPDDVRRYVRPSLSHHGLTLALGAASQLLPVVAGLLLLPTENASFAVAWQLATFVFLPPYLLATALFAHGSAVGVDGLRLSMGRTLPAGLGLSALLVLGAWALGEPLLMLFGGDYPQQSWLLLSVLAPAGLWMVVKDHLVALWRAQGRTALATWLAVGCVLLEVAAAATGARLGGSSGLAVGWLLGSAAEAILAVPLVRGELRGLRWTSPWRLLHEARRGPR